MGFVSAIGSQNLNMSVGGINGYFSTMQCSHYKLIICLDYYHEKH